MNKTRKLTIEQKIGEIEFLYFPSINKLSLPEINIEIDYNLILTKAAFGYYIKNEKLNELRFLIKRSTS